MKRLIILTLPIIICSLNIQNSEGTLSKSNSVKRLKTKPESPMTRIRRMSLPNAKELAAEELTKKECASELVVMNVIKQMSPESEIKTKVSVVMSVIKQNPPDAEIKTKVSEVIKCFLQ